MTRRSTIAMILGLLVLGAAINLVVAWALALWVRPDRTNQIHTTFDPRPMMERYCDEQALREPYEIKDPVWLKSPGASVYSVTVQNLSRSWIEAGAVVAEWRHGWPANTLRCGMWGDRTTGTPAFKDAWVVTADIGWLGIIAGRPLPYGVMWPGTIINTLFYGAAAWLALWMAQRARHLARRVRGRCTRCAYDLRGQAPDSSRCPECGGAVKR